MNRVFRIYKVTVLIYKHYKHYSFKHIAACLSNSPYVVNGKTQALPQSRVLTIGLLLQWGQTLLCTMEKEWLQPERNHYMNYLKGFLSTSYVKILLDCAEAREKQEGDWWQPTWLHQMQIISDKFAALLWGANSVDGQRKSNWCHLPRLMQSAWHCSAWHPGL